MPGSQQQRIQKTLSMCCASMDAGVSRRFPAQTPRLFSGPAAGESLTDSRLEIQRGSENQLCVNRHAYRHSGYVSGVNECAKHSTGDVLVVIADDFFPCPKWDEEIIDAWRRATTPGRPDFQGNIAPAECVIWCPTNTPQEFERNIMVAPILFRSRYERLGYVFYPSYESMYADNDFAEHAQFDYREGRCVIIIGNFVLEHRHPFFQPEKMDDAYRAGNHPEAYELGRKLLDARRACNFGDVQQIKIPKRRIAICYLGETFPLRWVQAFSDLLAKLGFVHDVQIFSGYSTQVYLGRAAHAKGVLEMLMDQDYILWIDDDNPPFPDQVDQLLADLEARPEIGMVAGWTMTLSDCASFGGIVEGKRIDADVATFLTQGPDLQRIAWTGFPMVLMRYALLKDVGYRAFLPIQEGSESGNHLAFGWLGEDIGFCKVAVEKGWALFVDRRVRLEHLKTVDICASYLPPAKSEALLRLAERRGGGSRPEQLVADHEVQCKECQRIMDINAVHDWQDYDGVGVLCASMR